jgi:hypothetical protein
MMVFLPSYECRLSHTSPRQTWKLTVTNYLKTSLASKRPRLTSPTFPRDKIALNLLTYPCSKSFRASRFEWS